MLKTRDWPKPLCIIALLVTFAPPVWAQHAPVFGTPTTGSTLVIRADDIVSPESVSDAMSSASKLSSHALQTGQTRVVGWSYLPASEPYQGILNAKETKHSLSLGSVGTGTLQRAAALEYVGPHHEIIERHRKHGTSYGTQELVNVIEAAAAHVADNFPGAPLRVGNLSRSQGGDIRWSRSHNSGRDADLAFFLRQVADKTSVPSPDLLEVSDEGIVISRPDLEFDVARNWLLVRGLLATDTTIQYLFISLALKAKLLAYARTTGEPEELIARAALVLHQPTDALPHDDHFHLRIGCPKADRLQGCLESGPRWEWVDWHYDDLLAQALELSKAMDDKDEETRLAALDYLGSIRSPYASEIALLKGVHDPSPIIRERAWALARYGWPWSATALIEAQKLIVSETTDMQEKAVAYSILRRSTDTLAHQFAMTRLQNPDVAARERVYAARTLTHSTDPSLVPKLARELLRQPLLVRIEIIGVLRRITNAATEVDWEQARADEVKRGAELWLAWYKEHAAEPRESWLFDGFRQTGAPILALDVNAVDMLIKLLPSADPHVVYNINRLLRQITGRWAPLEQRDGRKLHTYWDKWWKKNKARKLAAESSPKSVSEEK